MMPWKECPQTAGARSTASTLLREGPLTCCSTQISRSSAASPGVQDPFASNDSKLSEKYQAIAKAAGDADGLTTIGERLLCQQQAQAWQSGLALVNFAKATVVGDILADALPQVAWMSKTDPLVCSPRSPSLNHRSQGAG
jgi:hypothetical protein